MHVHVPTLRAGVLFLSLALLPLSCSLPAQAQAPLTLPQAVSIALEKNPIRKAALADERAAAAGIREARSGLLPRIVFSESATRGNDRDDSLHRGKVTRRLSHLGLLVATGLFSGVQRIFVHG